MRSPRPGRHRVQAGVREASDVRTTRKAGKACGAHAMGLAYALQALAGLARFHAFREGVGRCWSVD
jgi:hypothetical protein